MPGRLILTSPLDDIAAWSGGAVACLDHVARRNIAPGQDVLVMTGKGELRLMRWGIIPVGRVNARGRPVMETIINARSETVFDKSAFQGVRRCLIPVNGWYEWTGEKRRKQAWRIRRADRGLFAFAGIWDSWSGPGGVTVAQAAAVTCEPNEDVADYHHRMGVVEDRGDFEKWLTGSDDDARELCKPASPGSFVVETADDVDWNAP